MDPILSIHLVLLCVPNKVIVICFIPLFVSVELMHFLCHYSQPVHPLVIAAHPSEPNQLAIGMTDGTVKVLEPTESEGRWGMAVPVDNGVANGRTAASSTNSNPAADQLQR